MDFPLTLRCFALALTLVSVALIPLFARRGAAGGSVVGASSRLPAGMMPRPQWPAALTRAGIVCLLLSFVVLMAVCEQVLAP